MERQIQQLTRIVDDLLDVSRITQGKIKIKKEPVDVAVVVSRAIETSRPLIDARKHELTVELTGNPVWVDGDLTRLAQVLGNLLNNAAKYTEPGGKIRLEAKECSGANGTPGHVRIRVTDNGVGISAEMLQHIFDLFAQAERTLDRAQGGLGIGLALVQRLVALHDGTVTARSDGPGAGSEFEICLPLLHAKHPAASPPSTASDHLSVG